MGTAAPDYTMEGCRARQRGLYFDYEPPKWVYGCSCVGVVVSVRASVCRRNFVKVLCMFGYLPAFFFFFYSLRGKGEFVNRCVCVCLCV